MATQQATVDEIVDRLAGAGPVTARKMFGEYCIYLDGKPVALVCDDTLFVKPTDTGRELMPDSAEGPPYPGAKPHLIVPDDADREALRRLMQATAAELPMPKPRKKPTKPGTPKRGGNSGPGR